MSDNKDLLFDSADFLSDYSWEDMIGLISFETRVPLQGAKGWCDLLIQLEREQLTDEQRKQALESLRRYLDQIDQVITMCTEERKRRRST